MGGERAPLIFLNPLSREERTKKKTSHLSQILRIYIKEEEEYNFKMKTFFFAPFTILLLFQTVISIHALAGFGGSSSTKKNVNKKKSSMSKFDAQASLLRCEVQYEELLKLYENPDVTKDNEEEEEIDTNLMEYLVAARCKRVSGFQDWVPIAQLVLVMGAGFESALSLQKALSLYCREIHAAGSYAAPVLSTASRNEIEYSVEPLSTWQKFVYDDVIEQQQKSKGNAPKMTRAQAREVLGLVENEDDRALVKKAWRMKSFEFHPDRFVGREETEEAIAAPVALEKVNLAYETLSSGIKSNGSGGSWYESLGGKQRQDFSGAMKRKFHILCYVLLI